MAGMAGGITRMVSVQWEMEPCIIECAQGGGTKKGSPDTKGFPDKKIEQVMGIEPTPVKGQRLQSDHVPFRIQSCPQALCYMPLTTESPPLISINKGYAAPHHSEYAMPAL